MMRIQTGHAPMPRMFWATSFIALAAPGCHLGGSPVPPAPPPTEFEVTIAPGAVLTRAAEALQQLGWWVAPVDTTSGHLRAEHHARGDANGQWMACVNGVGRTGDTRRATKDLTSTVVVQLRAEKKGSGSQVRIIGTVPSAYSLFAFTEKGPPEYAVAQCVSTGAIEARIREVLVATQ